MLTLRGKLYEGEKECMLRLSQSFYFQQGGGWRQMIGEQVHTVDASGKRIIFIYTENRGLVHAVDLGDMDGYDMYLIAIREITADNCDKVHGVVKVLVKTK